MHDRIAALALGLVVLAGCQGGGPDASPEPSRSGCPAVEIVGLRGQGQSLEANAGLGTEVRLISDELANDVESLGTVRTTAIRHVSRLGSWDEYVEDVADGRKRLNSTLGSIVADCPDTRIVVIGFSQGSQIAREELAAQPRLTRNVDALVLVGSPMRDPTSPFHQVPLAGGVPTSGGRLGPGPDLGDLSARTVEACITGDAVCASDDSSDDSIHRQAYEEPSVAGAIASAAATLLTE